MPRFTFPEWTETLKKWINLLVLGAPVYLVDLPGYGYAKVPKTWLRPKPGCVRRVWTLSCRVAVMTGR